ncbi:putative inner membrane protein [Citrobacter youngae]|nr:putative inner membrane protein [Citrobacter youngae]
MSWQHFKQAWLIKFWAPAPAVIAAGILSTYYFGITGTFWAVTGEFTRWGGQILQLFGVHAEEWGYYKLIHLEGSPLTRIDGMMILGMFGGCFAAALWANNVKLRMPRSRIRILQAVVGGMIAGFGARLAMGCNLAAFLPAFHSSRCMPGSSRWQRLWAHGLAPALPCYRCFVFRSKCRKFPPPRR